MCTSVIAGCSLGVARLDAVDAALMAERALSALACSLQTRLVLH